MTLGDALLIERVEEIGTPGRVGRQLRASGAWLAGSRTIPAIALISPTVPRRADPHQAVEMLDSQRDNRGGADPGP